MSLPAYAWPDTDEMNMCGTAIKNVRSYGGDFRGWAAHDNYISQRGKAYYFRTNCPESKATKNYKGKDWTPGAKMRAKPKMHKKRMHKKHKKHMHKKHHAHNPNHKNHADCIRVDKMNNSRLFIQKATRGLQRSSDADFYRQAQAVLNMGKAKRVSKKRKMYKKMKKKAHNPNHKNHADCIRVDGMNNAGSAVRLIRKR
ncbi:hypothetical protein GQR58_006858 [Nymphon striatum]|nr:hypothetical protein GQR58_006858 [Nymphon striatum]